MQNNFERWQSVWLEGLLDSLKLPLSNKQTQSTTAAACLNSEKCVTGWNAVPNNHSKHLFVLLCLIEFLDRYIMQYYPFEAYYRMKLIIYLCCVRIRPIMLEKKAIYLFNIVKVYRMHAR